VRASLALDAPPDTEERREHTARACGRPVGHAETLLYDRTRQRGRKR
jgi:hypothetical protein